MIIQINKLILTHVHKHVWLQACPQFCTHKHMCIQMNIPHYRMIIATCLVLQFVSKMFLKVHVLNNLLGGGNHFEMKLNGRFQDIGVTLVCPRRGFQNHDFCFFHYLLDSLVLPQSSTKQAASLYVQSNWAKFSCTGITDTQTRTECQLSRWKS